MDLHNLALRWPSALVAREEVGRFTGGILSAKYLANLDSQGLGPDGAIYIGRKVAYPIDSLVSWLEHRARDRRAK